MRKYIVLTLLLCVHLFTQAQLTYRYWFDVDEATMQEGVSATNEWQMDIDVSNLAECIHQFHVQVMDKNNTWSAPVTHWFVKTLTIACHGEYWFDDQVGNRHRVDVLNGHFVIDVNALTDGIHMLTYQLCDANDSPLAQYRALFQKSPTPTNANVHYWVDEETEKMQTLAYNGELHVLDLSGVSDGLHLLHIQVEDSSPSSTLAKMFIKIPQTEGVDELCCICTIDGELVKQENVANSDGVLNWLLDVSEIPLGFHHIMVQVITKNGAGSSMYEGYFLRDFSAAEMASLQCIYSIDGGEHKTMAGNMGSGVFHFDLDVADIENGLHNITYMLLGEGGVGTKSNSALFWKTPIGGNGVTQYCYWLNDMTEKHEVKLAKRTNPYNLVALLPVEQMPIRSSCFMFRVNDGVPTLYAKNDIHFAFTDASGITSTANAQYVDESVSEIVSDFSDLQLTQTFARPSENEVKWFKFEAEEGDSVIFKASQATTIQVFAPSGKEVYSASADKSVIWGGCHTWENGTFYVAVHDVTGTKPNVTLDYMHMDKYDVVAQDVTVVGNGGCSTITYQGNGFRDLYAVDLYSEHGDTIHSIDVGHESDATTTVTFDFSGAELGMYSALFHFTEEDKRFADNITVEEARDIELETKVSYPSTFLRGTTVTYTVEITNKGNSTAYNVPLYVNITTPNVKSISNIKLQGLFLPSIYDIIDKDSLTNKELAELREFPLFENDIHNFFVSKRENSNNSGSTIVLANYFFTNIEPNVTKTIHIGIKANDIIDVHITTPLEWASISMGTKGESKSLMMRASSNAMDQICCFRHKFQCFVRVSTNIIGLANFIASFSGENQITLCTKAAECVANAINDAHSFVWTQACGEEDYSGDDWFTDFFASTFKLKRSSHLGLIASCTQALFPKVRWLSFMSKIGKADSFFDLFGFADISNDCDDFWSPITDCPPEPPQGGSSTPVNSYDPNDIIGYIASSGSMHISEDVVNVSYRIEFENDTTFATTSAHTVVVTDTLDGAKFDLSSFTPTSIMIGDKSVQLKGDKTFVTTIDMRPAINVIAQVEGKYDEEKGIATWLFTSLDPMTMEPTDDVMQGFLPVNYDGTSGMGEVAFDISLRQGLADGTEIPNRASIVFDSNEPILTPTWTNIVDAVAPTSMVSDLIVRNDSICDLSFEGEDNRSGIWKYTLYVQDGLSAPWREVAADIAPDSTYSFKGFDCINYGFCVLATDSAGNVERKELTAEVVKMTMHPGDVNADGDINVIDFTAIANHIMGSTPTSFVVEAADVNEDGDINVMDLTGVANLILFGEVSPNRAQANSRMRRVSDQLTLHVSDCEVMAGEEFTVDIHMDGDADFSAFQFDMVLPEGIHVKMVDGAPCATLSTERTNTADTDFFVSRLSDDGTLRVFCASTRNVGFEGNEGCVAHVTLVADEKAPAGDYEVAVSHIVAAYGGTGENLSPANFVATVGGSTDMNSLIDGTHGSSLYDMVGKKIRKDHERTGLEKGAYIKNGKKVIVK